MAQSRPSGAVRNTPFLRLEHKIPLHPSAARAAHTGPEDGGRLRAYSGRYTAKLRRMPLSLEGQVERGEREIDGIVGIN